MYVSMFSLIVVLFFAVTGITLNHPEWTFGGKEVHRQYKGKLDPRAITDDKVDWLKVVEQLRKDQPVRGAASDMRVDADEGSLSFKAPGYTSECFFKLADGSYEMRTNSQGWVAAMNDLHRGRDAGGAWFWLIDLSGVILAFVSVTGLGIMFYLKKSRVATFILCGIGLVVFAALMAGALR